VLAHSSSFSARHLNSSRRLRRYRRDDPWATDICSSSFVTTFTITKVIISRHCGEPSSLAILSPTAPWI